MKTTAGLALAASAASLSSAAKNTKRPNIVFFLTDDQRNDTLGCAGHPIVKTPVIDSLASEGVRFENMFVTTSICMTSRTSILTGQFLRTHAANRTQAGSINAEACREVFPKMLRKAGYRTGFVGKWHTRNPPDEKAETWFDSYEKLSRHPYWKKQPDGSMRHLTEVTGDRAIDFLKGQTDDQPFSLTVWFNASHAEDGDKRPGVGHYPWPKAVDGMYDDIEMPPPRLNDPAIYDSQPDFIKGSINRDRYFWRWDTPEKYETNLRAYFRMLSGIDGVIGRVRRALEEQGVADNTIIVYSADNGYYMGDRGFAGKWSHYEQSLRVPLIVYDPRLPEGKRGRVVDPMALNIDLPATFLDWAGAEIPDVYQGRSFAPIVNGDAPKDWRSHFFCEHGLLAPSLSWEGVRGERYVYARYFDQDPPYEFLHDLKNDPDQLENLALTTERAELLDSMRDRCDEYIDRYGGPFEKYKPAAKKPTRQKARRPTKKK